MNNRTQPFYPISPCPDCGESHEVALQINGIDARRLEASATASVECGGRVQAVRWFPQDPRGEDEALTSLYAMLQANAHERRLAFRRKLALQSTPKVHLTARAVARRRRG